MRIPYFIVKPDERARALNVVGTKVTVLASNAATQSLGITFQQGDEGTGPPPHRHDWDECFYVLKGEMEFFCDGSIHKCVPGTLVYLPRGTLHGFRFGIDGQVLEITGNGALAAQMFTAIDDEIPGFHHPLRAIDGAVHRVDNKIRSSIRPDANDGMEPVYFGS
jgi:quercetin dioxygenase-like cupin family protein